MKRTDRIHDEYFGSDHVTVIEPIEGWRTLDLKELWAYRELFWVLTMRDVKVRYKQTVLGATWAIIRPVTTMVIFSVIFGRLAKMPSDGFPYPIFVYAGLLPWLFFASAITASGQSLIGSSQLVSKVYFPRLIIPMSSIGVGLVDLAVATGILLLMMLYYGVGWSLNLFAAPILLIAVIFTALGIGNYLSALNAAYRDFTHVMPFLVQIWMYMTPVIYPVSLVPNRWQWVLYMNPMTGLIEGFRSSFLGKPFDVSGLAISFIVAIVMFVFGIAYFEKIERRLADII